MKTKAALKAQQPAVRTAENVGETSSAMKVVAQGPSSSKIAGRTINMVGLYFLINLRATGLCSRDGYFGQQVI